MARSASPLPALTLFAVPKAFHGHVGLIQRNAIQSWLQLQPQPEIILLGNDDGTAAIARELHLNHQPDIRTTPQGTPLLNDIFARAHQIARHPLLVYVNADIILTGDFLPSLQRVLTQHDRFLLLGRRWNLDLTQPLNFNNPDWENELHQRVQEKGIFSGIGALDYFVFPKPLFRHLPEFAIGRPGWDNWMVGEALRQGHPVINASQVITAIHQNHDYRHLPGNRLEAFHGREAQHNQHLLQGHFAGNSADATTYLAPLTPANTPKVSVILTSHDATISPSPTITSVLQEARHHPHLNLELIVVADGAKFTTASFSEFPNDSLTIIECRDGGLLAARNRGLDRARGELVLFLTPHTTLLPQGLADLVACFDERAGSLEFAIGGVQIHPPQRQPQPDLQPWHVLNPILSGRDGLHGLHVWMLPTLWHSLRTETILFNRRWLQRRGGFDRSFSPFAATLNRLLDLCARGAAGWCVPRAVVSSPPPAWQDPTALAQTAKDCEQLLQYAFLHPTLRDWMRPLQPLARDRIALWLACQAYLLGDVRALSHCLLVARRHSPDVWQDTLPRWQKRIAQFARAFGYDLDPQHLSTSSLWQQALETLEGVTV